MGKGLSPLQKNILAVLEEFPTVQETRHRDRIVEWARPCQIMKRLRLPPTASNRVAVSKSLQRLCERGMVEAACAQVCLQGHGWRYLRNGQQKAAK